MNNEELEMQKYCPEWLGYYRGRKAKLQDIDRAAYVKDVELVLELLKITKENEELKEYKWMYEGLCK